ncbi:MAG: methyl-accepting chemotaxis protein, partial [Bacteroidota bacterium]
MNYFKGLSGKFIIPYVFLLFFGIWAYITIENILSLESLKYELQYFKSQIEKPKQVEMSFFADEFRSENFLRNGESKLVVTTREILKDINAQTDKLSSFSAIEEGWVDSVSIQVFRYAQSFDQLAVEMKKKGFQDFGLEGNMREVIHEVENSTIKYDRVFMLMLRRHEKDFLMRKDLKYLTRFNEGILKFKNHVNNLSIAKSKKDELFVQIEEYNKLFEELVRTQQNIGLTENLGLRARLGKSIKELKLLVDTKLDKVSSLVVRKVMINKILLIVLFFLIFGMGIFILRKHILTITKSIDSLSKVSQELALGKLPDKVKILSKDELGLAQESVNKLIAGQAKKVHFSKAISDGNLGEDMELLSSEDVLGKSLLKMRKNLDQLMKETNRVLDLANKEGNLHVSLKLDYEGGAWGKFSNNLNGLFATILTPLKEINLILQHMADGDISNRFEGEIKGDVGNLMNNLNHALDRLSVLIRNNANHSYTIQDTADVMESSSTEMNEATAEIASAIAQMTSGANQQVGRVDEISDLISQISNSASEMENEADEARLESEKGVENCQSGEKLVDSVVSDIESINNHSTDVQDAIAVLEKRSDEIGR